MHEFSVLLRQSRRAVGYGLLCGNCAAICRELGQSAKAEEYEVQRKKYCPEA
mgnify:CR=1 FL=1